MVFSLDFDKGHRSDPRTTGLATKVDHGLLSQAFAAAAAIGVSAVLRRSATRPALEASTEYQRHLGAADQAGEQN